MSQNEHHNKHAPIVDCEHKNKTDGCCNYPDTINAECHALACPRLNKNLQDYFLFSSDSHSLITTPIFDLIPEGNKMLFDI